MTLHKHMQEVFAAVKEMLEAAEAISGMRVDKDGDSTYTSYPFPTSPDRHCGDLLDDVLLGPATTSRRSYSPEAKLFKWEQAVSSDDRRVVKLLFADYREKKAKLAALLGRDMVEAPTAKKE